MSAQARQQCHHCDAETDCKHNQHVNQIEQCVFHVQQMWPPRCSRRTLDYLVMGAGRIMPIAKGWSPTETVAATVFVAVSITETVPESSFAT